MAERPRLTMCERRNVGSHCFPEDPLCEALLLQRVQGQLDVVGVVLHQQDLDRLGLGHSSTGYLMADPGRAEPIPRVPDGPQVTRLATRSFAPTATLRALRMR